MGWIDSNVQYCCVSEKKRILFEFSRGVHGIENLAAMCLEWTPPFHKWYFERKGRRTFGFLMDDGNVYFTIVDEAVRCSSLLQFLEQLRNEFRNAAKDHKGLSLLASSVNDQNEPSCSTKAHSLGKHEKKKLKEQAIGVGDAELEEQSESTGRGNQNEAGSSVVLHKDSGSTRTRYSSELYSRKWWRQVRIVLAINATVCLVLFFIWLSICKGIQCTQ